MIMTNLNDGLFFSKVKPIALLSSSPEHDCFLTKELHVKEALTFADTFL
jgi:hypothetical protein